MAKKTATEELLATIKQSIPAAATNESQMVMQSVLGKMAYEVQQRTLPKEKEQMRDAFYKGVVYGMLYNSTKPAEEKLTEGFDLYFKDTYQKD
jgi:hypothetical protein